MKELDILNIDKTNWKKYHFEEIAASISERVEPQETNLDIYVGLEHLDAESLHIKRTGLPSDVMGTKLKVYKGDVIFGKRRAYQRKASIAEFDGICSAHAMVLRANSNVIDSKLFPFFLHSDYFMHRAIDISVGGLSPTINWGTLKHQEFLLPPKDQQGKLAELLWAADKTVEKYSALTQAIQKVYLSEEDQAFKSDCSEKQLKDVIKKAFGGGTPDTKNIDFYKDGSIEWITTSTMNSLFALRGEKKITEKAVEKSATNILSEDNLIVGTRVGIGKCCILKSKMAFSQDVTGLELNRERVDPLFLALQIMSRDFQNRILKNARGTTIKGILKEDLLSSKIHLPPLPIQNQIAKRLFEIITLKQTQGDAQLYAGEIEKSLINQIFS